MARSSGNIRINASVGTAEWNRGIAAMEASLGRFKASGGKNIAEVENAINKVLSMTPKATANINGMSTAMMKNAQASKAAAGASANLVSQFNDIGVMLAAGQSPLQLAMQQGTQISQVLTQMGGGVGALRAIGSAFVGMLNPISLVTIATIAGVSAISNWIFKAKEKKNTADALKETLDRLRSANEGILSANAAVSASLSDQIAKYGQYWDSIRNVLAAKLELAKLEASEAQKKAVGAVGFNDSDIAAYKDQIEQDKPSLEFGSEYDRAQVAERILNTENEILRITKEKYGLTVEEYNTAMDIAKQLEDTNISVKERNDLSAQFVTLMEQGASAGAKNKEEMIRAGQAVAELADQSSQMAKYTEDASTSMSSFSATASAASLQHLVDGAASLISMLNSAASAVARIGSNIAALNSVGNAIGNTVGSGWFGNLASGITTATSNAYGMAVDRNNSIEQNGLGERPGRRPFELGMPDIDKPKGGSRSRGGGGGGAGRSGGKSEAEKDAERYAKNAENLNNKLKELQTTVKMTAEQEEIWKAQRDQGVLGNAAGMAAVENTVKNIQALEKQKEVLRQNGDFAKEMGNAFGEAFSSIISGTEKASDALKNLIKVIANRALTNLFTNLFAGNGFSFKNVVGAHANGGIVNTAMQLVGERGPELVSMPQGSRVSTAQQTARMLGASNNNSIRLQVVTDGMQVVRILDEAKSNSVAVTDGALKQYDKSFNNKIRSFQKNPNKA